MADERDADKEQSEPGSPDDLFPKAKPKSEPDKDIREKGEPDGGDNFA